MAAALVGSPLPAAADRVLRNHRGVGWNSGEGVVSGSGVADSADFMDKYIASSKGAGDGNVWYASSAAASQDASHAPAVAAAEKPWHRRRAWEPAAAGDSGPSAEAPRSSATQRNAVVDVKLDSELQESRGRSFVQARSAPGVDDAVQAQRLEDVYIHDHFSEAAAEDSKDLQALRDSRDLKA
ncbi:unnamed protein product [Prorocentrum cordatum]|uniref:Uncharacterized protein n=1 Tax=Prorocentrum cordatum TaxID=2364126 RepID=A0ABN9VPM7_9DINO|nr:unnamed protein product [Polarella glacialis]